LASDASPRYDPDVSKASDFLARTIGTAFGAGYSPFAPGTAGSLVGVLLFWPLAGFGWPWQLLACLGVLVVGTPAATRVATLVGRKDPGLVVVDEVAGQLITLVGMPLTLPVVLTGFVLFRIMDVVKPWPARALERLPGGWGIMADDVAAGVYAQLALRVLLLLWPVARP
jgi:phosphatidylglycerophosphatase A